MRSFATGLLFCSCCALMGCATYQDDLAQGQKEFERSEHERALAVFRVLEPDTGRLSPSDRARYAYLRGMTDYRIGYKNDARHWLALASAMEEHTPGALPVDWAKRMTESLKDLNEEVFTAGIQSLSNTGTPSKSKADDEGSSSDSDEPASKGSKSDKNEIKPDKGD